MEKHPLYDTYKSMKIRCYTESSQWWDRYGGRGIRVCNRWLEGGGQGFRNFAQDMGKKPSPQHSLDRIDNDGPYTPENCRWATKREQNLNTSRTIKFVRDGVTYKATELAEREGIDREVVIYRAKVGMSLAEIISKHHMAEGYSHTAALQASGTLAYTTRTHCKNGHEFSGSNLAFRKGGSRICVECRNEANRRYNARKAGSRS